MARNGAMARNVAMARNAAMDRELSENKKQKLKKVFDQVSNNRINFGEFLDLMQNMSVTEDSDDSDNSNSYSDGEIKEMFKQADKDGDGFITATELKQEMESDGEKWTKAQIKKVMKKADKDGDGRISFEEFSKMVKGSDSVEDFLDSD
jgi:Ca2+-binding EF-hand superfamily protein